MGAWRRGLAAAGLAGAAVLGAAACQPVDGSLNSFAVALTTDRRGTEALERRGIEVQWLSCTSTYGEGGRVVETRTPSVRSVATVDCEGETTDGRPITLTGKVTEERAGACVRGSLTAKVDGEQVFRSSVLGDCSAATPTRTRTVTPPPGDRGRPTVTVTVTVTESFRGK
ncbi:hypothetical protein [Streptomyces sp. NPDC060194]|uniref:hypothetical protein n=1 Tax=Streptomyces sp. NPDC060194 TaxID=3347069 RepID=UPI00365D4676